MGIRKKITTPHEPVIIFELVPPPTTVSLEASLTTLGRALKNLGIDAINIPEVRDGGKDPRYPAHEVARALKKNGSAHLPIILNHPVVYDPWKLQQKTISTIYKPLDIASIVLVGGASSHEHYPGPTVPEAAKLLGKDIKANGFRPTIGSITIQTRSHELRRLCQKAQNGVAFFTSQVIVDSKPINALLLAYDRHCKKYGEKPGRIFLSFAPISSKRDVEFLQLLRVTVPKKSIDYLFDGWLGTGYRSIDLARKTLIDILTFVKENQLSVPIGLNIGYVVRHNFELALELAAVLTKEYKKFYV